MKKITAILLSILMLAISFRVSVAFHYCGGNLAQYKLDLGYGEASCGMKNNAVNYQDHSSASVSEESCCKNHLQQVATDVFHFASNMMKCMIDNPIDLVRIAFLVTAKNIEHNGFASYRPPPNVSSVFLPFIEVSRI
ncbi:MAG: hypothetical protein WCL14_11230 [Bacteroidota bacterium]